MLPYAYRTSVEYSCAAGVPGGRYYWTNTYYWESVFDYPPSDISYNRVNLACLDAISEACTRERWQVVSAFGTGSYAAENVGPVPGHIPGTDRNLLNDSVLAVALMGTSGYWYKRLRGLLSAADVAGGVVSDYIISWLTDTYLVRLNSVPLVNSNRIPVGTIRLKPEIHHWQYRHGTKRRARRVLQPIP